MELAGFQKKVMKSYQNKKYGDFHNIHNTTDSTDQSNETKIHLLVNVTVVQTVAAFIFLDTFNLIVVPFPGHCKFVFV